MKKIIFIIIFIILFLGIGQNVYAGKLLLDYPEMGGIKLSEEPTLPEMVKYIYLFSLGIVGFVALISMLIGAIRYITSAGDASKAEDAKDQMTQAIFGIIILLAAVLILRTINPDLVNIGFKLPAISGGGGGGGGETIGNYECLCCCRTTPLSCNPEGNLGTRLACLPNLTKSQADTACDTICKNWCPGISIFGYNYLTKLNDCQ